MCNSIVIFSLFKFLFCLFICFVSAFQDPTLPFLLRVLVLQPFCLHFADSITIHLCYYLKPSMVSSCPIVFISSLLPLISPFPPPFLIPLSLMLLALGFNNLTYLHWALLSHWTFWFSFLEHFLAILATSHGQPLTHIQAWGCSWTLRLLDFPHRENIGIKIQIKQKQKRKVKMMETKHLLDEADKENFKNQESMDAKWYIDPE